MQSSAPSASSAVRLLLPYLHVPVACRCAAAIILHMSRSDPGLTPAPTATTPRETTTG
ncbi:MAG: hypothetical protein JWN79_497 [Gemmatimonadetes bacterium]|jgi:hypothetical protein|nr:hypothetical protein [Gemmatimonadota bacterium]